ncbi:hypothetical protein ACA30_21235 [Virgibacillus soli]|uniref:DUF1963 domain-containing protein n=1 Tax=Lederbergia galactosidilytica TaxID=217031 RepID=A0A177ZVP7_9BACI|nr:hypothetical protein ACA30_21235 [Virgibacillus soli]OAK71976.1 hypothetical protein ABB05_10095 [Lederbergia galactosidilytica]
MKLPQPLQPYADALAKTKKPCLIIHGKIGKTTPLQSKFAGNPYWLKADPYPTTKKGEPLRLLAQINFNDIETIPNYPEEGILQFFVADDDVYGLDFDDGTNQDTFRVVYHEKVESDPSKWLSNFPVFAEDDHYFPINKECALTFERSEELMSSNDYRFNKLTNLNSLLESEEDEDYDTYDEIIDAYSEVVKEQGSKLGGYPFFTQEDPRAYGDYLTFDTLLFQIDTDDELDIMWGDSGVGNFFIAYEDLKKRDFSKVLYNWDCY